MENGKFLVVGIDPGLDGAVAGIHLNGALAFLTKTPTILKKAGSSKRLYDVGAMARLLSVPDIIMIALEKAQAMPGQGVSSMFSIGLGFGLWQGIIVARAIPHTIMHPRTWQKLICEDVPGDTKAKAIQAAGRIFPSVSLLPTPACKKPHTGFADALCMAEFARRITLGSTGAPPG